MASIGITLTTSLVSTFIGKQILTKAISDASGSILGSITSIFNYNSNIDEIILKLDIKERINTINCITKNIKNHNEAIEKCLTSIHDIIIDIKQDLKVIELRIEKHKSKYMSSWRKIKCKKEIKKLTIDSDLLEKRLEYLVKALQISSFNDICQNN